MNLVDLETELAALGSYTVGSTGQDLTNKTRAQRRIHTVKADIISRYGGKWDANYREGWLPLVPLYITGTADFTNASQTVSGTNTVWTTAMKGYKILAPDGAYYRISSVVSATSLILSQPFQGTTITGQAYQIWKDEYTLHPDVLTLQGFVNYTLPATIHESWPREMKESYPKSIAADNPKAYQVVGREKLSTTYSTGTISGSINSNVLTGSGTAWLANIQPGYEITIGAYSYHVSRVNSDTEIELHQQLVAAASSLTYTAKGKNSLKIRFSVPTTQQVVSYWYWGKDYPLVNDNDEDWVAEMFPRVIIDGSIYYDYLDKNDVPRAVNSRQIYENSIKDMKVAVDNAYSGVRTIPLDIPEAARE